MLSIDKILKETSPLSIFFVRSGSSGNRLLFRYPYDENFYTDPELSVLGEPATSDQDRIQTKSVIDENDEALCNMFSVNPNLCGQKFEIKINNVRHVGHPMSLLTTTPANGPSASLSALSCGSPKNPARSPDQHHRSAIGQHSSSQRTNLVDSPVAPYDRLRTTNRLSQTAKQTGCGDITSFNIVCALRASASYDIVDCYYDLSKRLAIALSFEERRCSYLSKEIRVILAALEERDMTNMENSDQQEQSLDNNNLADSVNSYQSSREQNAGSVFHSILSRSNLARDLKRVFTSLSTTGIVDLKINNWVSVSFCLPQKVHRLKLLSHKSMSAIGTNDIKKCLLYLRPYHGLLLLDEPQELLDSLPIDASPAFIQLIRVTKPDKNFMDLSVDANLTLSQIFCIVSQLVYWAKAIIIYPICDSNIYAIHPLASTGIRSKLVNDFHNRFPDSKSLHHYLTNFSEGTSLSQLNGPLLSLAEKQNLLTIVTWLLQKRILTQIHKYIFLVVDRDSKLGNVDKSFSDKLDMSPGGIEINSHHQTHNVNQQQINSNGAKVSSLLNNSLESSHPIQKNSFTESFDSSIRRYRADSFPESQEDSNFGLNFSLSSTPNSNMEYPSPNNDINMRSSFSSSFPIDSHLLAIGNESILTALHKAGLSQAGIKSILGIPSSRNADDMKLLIRLIPYFDGRHHVEDIMFFENLERSQVLILCDKFRDVLFTCHHEDEAVIQLNPYSSNRG